MNKRPIPVTVISWLFIAVGCITFVAGLLRYRHDAASELTAELRGHNALDMAFVSVSSLLAFVGGVFMLRGFNSARWLCVAWMGFHVILSLIHSLFELAVHGLLFAGICYFLFRPRASAFFRGTLSALLAPVSERVP